ncbi:MAG: hypothetical protein N2645_01130 [Clostridia bacterium]|nr:hypothetical protein [Clostridia bacterium]
MMRTFLSLVKTSLNVNFGISVIKHRFTREKKKRLETIAVLSGAFIGIISIMVFFSIIYWSIFQVFNGGMGASSEPQPQIVITLAFLMGQAMVLFFGIFYIMSAFYFSNDLNILMPLPLKPSYVLGSKFIVVMVNEYLTLLPVMFPALIIYGFGTGQGILYWIKGLMLFLVSPVIPLGLASIFVVLLMRFTNLRKSKDLLAVIGGFIGVFIAIGSNYYFQGISGGTNNMGKLVADNAEIVNKIGQNFPPVLWATKGISQGGISGFGYFLLFLGVSVLIFFLLMWLGNRIFYKALLAGKEITRKRKAVSFNGDQYRKRKSHPVVALFWREWKVFLRTPIYAMNGLAGVIMGPVFIAMPFITQRKNAESILSAFEKPENITLVTLGILAAALFVASMNIVACTSVSREGATFWISKMIPVSAKHQILAKVLHGFCISIMGVLIITVLLKFLIGYSFLRSVLIIFLGALGSILLVTLNVMIDVIRPKLEWTNPQEAVKSNLNGLFGIMISLLSILLLGAFVLVSILLGIPAFLIYIGLALLMGFLAILSLLGLFKIAEKKYAGIEV